MDSSAETDASQQELAICSICEKQVVDGSETEDGDDAVFCDGEYQCWLHRTCVCLPKSEFAKLKTEEPFYCPRCSSNMQMKIISARPYPPLLSRCRNSKRMEGAILVKPGLRLPAGGPDRKDREVLCPKGEVVDKGPVIKKALVLQHLLLLMVQEVDRTTYSLKIKCPTHHLVPELAVKATRHTRVAPIVSPKITAPRPDGNKIPVLLEP